PQRFQIGTDGESAYGEMVTKRFFEGLRPVLAAGRGLVEADHDAAAEAVAVISWRLWQEKFQGRPDVLGETLDIGQAGSSVRVLMNSAAGQSAPGAGEEPAATRFRIVGVMGRQYTGTLPAGNADLEARFWIPIERGLPMMLPP